MTREIVRKTHGSGVVCRGVREGWDKGGEDGEGGIGEVQDRGSPPT